MLSDFTRDAADRPFLHGQARGHFSLSLFLASRRQLLRNTCRGGAAKNPAENQLALVVGAAASSLSVEPSCEKKVSCVLHFG